MVVKKTEQRQHPRTFLTARIKVIHESIGEGIYETRDISDGGAFIVAGDRPFPPLGSVVTVQLQGLPIPAPEVSMVVVRRGVDGFGLRFSADETDSESESAG